MILGVLRLVMLGDRRSAEFRRPLFPRKNKGRDDYGDRRQVVVAVLGGAGRIEASVKLTAKLGGCPGGPWYRRRLLCGSLALGG
jgi:hypothetical protein